MTNPQPGNRRWQISPPTRSSRCLLLSIVEQNLVAISAVMLTNAQDVQSGHYVKTCHPQNRKHITYQNAATRAPSHGHGQHAYNLVVRPCGFRVNESGQTKTDMLITIIMHRLYYKSKQWSSSMSLSRCTHPAATQISDRIVELCFHWTSSMIIFIHHHHGSNNKTIIVVTITSPQSNLRRTRRSAADKIKSPFFVT